MTLSESNQEAYHLDIQFREIAEMSARTEKFETRLAGMDITVFPKVYPGGIDSELACEAIGNTGGMSVLDLCTGTGVVAIKAALMGADKVVAVDLNPEAVKNARFNAEELGLTQVDVLEGSLFEPIGDDTFDIIVVNPPYTGKKPANKTEICFWDEDNLTTRKFFNEYRKYLQPDGRAFLCWADFSSLTLIEELANKNHVRLELINSRKTPSGMATFLVYQLLDL